MNVNSEIGLTRNDIYKAVRLLNRYNGNKFSLK